MLSRASNSLITRCNYFLSQFEELVHTGNALVLHVALQTLDRLARCNILRLNSAHHFLEAVLVEDLLRNKLLLVGFFLVLKVSFEVLVVDSDSTREFFKLLR